MIAREQAMIFGAWGRDGQANTLVEGSDRPRYGDGTPQEDCPELIWTIEAKSWEEANQRYHELQGWEPYVPSRHDVGQ